MCAPVCPCSYVNVRVCVRACVRALVHLHVCVIVIKRFVINGFVEFAAQTFFCRELDHGGFIFTTTHCPH